MAKREHITKRRQEVNAAKQRITLFKAAWGPSQSKHKIGRQKPDLSQVFTCSGEHVLCKPIESVMCTCSRRPVVTPETVDLYSYRGLLEIVVHPSLDHNQPYLDLLHHSPFHHTPVSVCPPLTITFADVAASAGNVELLHLLFNSPDPCVRNFYSQYYSYQDPTTMVKLFAHALNGGCLEVVMFLVENFFEELTANVKVAILETCLWLATTEKSLQSCFQQLALRFGVDIVKDDDTYRPLHLTCLYDNGDAAAFLIDNGADMYAENSHGWTVAYCAYKYGTHTFGLHRVLKTMMDKGLGVEAVMVKGSHFRCPLMYTLIDHSQLELMQYLVKCGHGIDMPIRFIADDKQCTISPLMHALACKSSSCASWLIEQGADVNNRSSVSLLIMGDNSWTPLHLAVSLFDLSMVKTLVQHGARLDAVTTKGVTVLSLAFERLIKSDPQTLPIISYLIQINSPIQSIPADCFVVKNIARHAFVETTSENVSMLDIAVMSGDPSIVDLLLRSGHHPKSRSDEAHQCQRWAKKQLQEYIALRKIPLLQALCRDSLRTACGMGLLPYVNTTLMPARLRSFLLMENIFGSIDEQTDDQNEDMCER